MISDLLRPLVPLFAAAQWALLICAVLALVFVASLLRRRVR